MVADASLDRVRNTLFGFDRAVEDSLLVDRVEREDALFLFDEGDRLVGDFLRPLLVFFAAQDREGIFHLQVCL